MKDFEKKNVYIVGGSSGIGLAAAKSFAASGANVIIFARRQNVLEKAVKEIAAAAPSKAQRIEGVPLDVTNHLGVGDKLPEAVRQFGAPDVLINSAGISRPGYFDSISYEDFDDVLKTNLYGIRNVTTVVAPFMKERRSGHIINVSSIAGYIGVFGFSAYSASKFAVNGFSEVLRSELKPYNVRVSIFCPPDTDTPLMHESDKTKPPETKEISKTAKIMSADDVAKCLLKGLKRNTFIIIPGFDGKWIHVAKRLFPSLVDYIIDSSIRKAQKF